MILLTIDVTRLSSFLEEFKTVIRDLDIAKCLSSVCVHVGLLILEFNRYIILQKNYRKIVQFLNILMFQIKTNEKWCVVIVSRALFVKLIIAIFGWSR